MQWRGVIAQQGKKMDLESKSLGDMEKEISELEKTLRQSSKRYRELLALTAEVDRLTIEAKELARTEHKNAFQPFASTVILKDGRTAHFKLSIANMKAKEAYSKKTFFIKSISPA
jgi:hypothetical protein